MTVTLRRWSCGPWTAGRGNPILLATGVDEDADKALAAALNALMAPVEDEPEPTLVGVGADGDLPHADQVAPATSSPRPIRSPLDPTTTWVGSAEDPADFGELLAPLLVDMRRLGLLAAPAGTMQLHFDPRPLSDFGSRCITWHPAEPDRFVRRYLSVGRDFRPSDIVSRVEAASFAVTAPAYGVLSEWDDLTLIATLPFRRQMSHLGDAGLVLDHKRQSDLLRSLADVDAVVAHLLAGPA